MKLGKKELTLIKYSSLSIDNSTNWITNIICNYEFLDDRIISSIPNLTDEQRMYLQYSLIKDFPRLIEEWNAISDIPIPNNNKIPCELCGNVLCIDLYQIQNSSSKKILKVGSSCITKFPAINRTFGKEGLEKIIIKNKKIMEKRNRENYLIVNVGSKEETYIKWLNTKFEFVLDDKTEVERNQLIMEFTSIYNEYIDKNSLDKDKAVNKLKEFRIKLTNFDNSILNNQKNCSIMKFDCPYFIEQWANNMNHSALNKIDFINPMPLIKSNQGKINSKSIKLIYCEEYFLYFKGLINSKLNKINVNISKIYDMKIFLDIPNNKSLFFAYIKDFMNYFGDLITDANKNITIDELLSILTVDFNNENDVNTLAKSFNYIMKDVGFEIKAIETYHENFGYNISYFLVNTKEKLYAKNLNSPLKLFLQNCIKNIYKLDYTRSKFTGNQVQTLHLKDDLLQNNKIQRPMKNKEYEQNIENSKISILKIITRINNWDDFTKLQDYFNENESEETI